ncbi:MAG: hypothetical protein NC911_07575 [Candidatus Omnitrophica bacterium]|nr:hypothetical protein [Candidatus Omnitrophota bacterium]
MRLGGHLLTKYTPPKEWTSLLKKCGYSAAYCPLTTQAESQLVKAYQEVARRHNILIAEVGAWANPLSSEPAERKNAREKWIQSLAPGEKYGTVTTL